MNPSRALLIMALGALLWAAPGCTTPPEPPPSPSPAAPTMSFSKSMALEALAKGDMKAARSLARQELAENPDQGGPHRVLSEVEFTSGNYDLALAEAQEAVRLSGERPETLFTLARVQLTADPQAGLETARKLAASDRGGSGSAVLLADATMYAAVARGAQGKEAREAALEARKILDPMKDLKPGSDLYGDYLAVLGDTYLLEGDLPEAAAILEKALEGHIGMHDRVTDIASALTWISFQEGDAKAAGAWLDRALKAMEATATADGFQFLPKWENYQLLRIAFTGEPAPGSDLARLDERYSRLRNEGYTDLATFREDRQLYRALHDAWNRKDYGQAYYLLEGRAFGDRAESAQGPLRGVESGEKAITPGCFYRLTVEEPANRIFLPLFLGRLAQRTGRKELAGYWYGKAAELAPGNKVVQGLAKGLPSGAQPEDMGAPGPEDTVRILARLADLGLTDPLLDGLEVLALRGVTRNEFDAQARAKEPGFEKVKRVLDEAVAALDGGARFQLKKGGEMPADRKDFGEKDWWGEGEALLDYGGSQPLRMHMEDQLWRITGFGEPSG